jgi:SOS-response transcriptional repressor LexA
MTQEVFFLIEQAAKKMKAEYEDGPILTHDPVPTYGHEVKVIRPREFDNNVSSISYDIVYTPFYGQTAAGKPISFDTLPGLVVPWAKEMIKGDPSRYFTVLVKGSSMTEAGIEDGDYALLRRAEAPRPNRIMLIRHGDESTLKRIKMKGDQEVYMCWEDGTDKEPIRLDDQDYEIQGEYVGILRGKLG